MMESSTFWEDSANGHQHVKYESCLNARGGESSQACKEEQGAYRYCEGNLNFATVATSEDDEYSSYHKKKISRDPMSHRIIEKRRRDRMNNCLADLSRLIPTDYLKKGRGRIEKTEIIEMAIKHMKHLQTHACRQLDSCDLPQQDLNRPEDQNSQHPAGGPIVIEHYRLGYQECLSETMHFLVEVEGFFAGDPLCVQLINHLQKHCDKILKGDRLNFPRAHNGETTSMSSNSSGYNNHHTSTGVSSGSPTSGSNSDSGRTEQKDSHAPSQSVAASHTDSNYFADISEEGCCEDGFINLTGPSQLREMLTSSNLATLQTSQTLTDLSRNSQMSHEEPVNTDHACASGGSTASLYKFKNNIKQRFTAEHHTHTVASNSVSGAKRKRFSNDQAQDLPMCRDSETCSIQSSPTPPLVSKYPPHSPSPDLSCSPPPPPLSKSANPSFGVPIFALHAKGSFYIPLTLDAHVLAPYLSAIGFGSDVSTFQNSIAVSDSMVLHPVTISVNFQLTNHHRLPNQQPLKQHSSVPSWKNELSGFPKWSVYSPDRN